MVVPNQILLVVAVIEGDNVKLKFDTKHNVCKPSCNSNQRNVTELKFRSSATPDIVYTSSD